ncbi:U3 small nucleolar RNA-associated 4-like [Olea europaea subsp. europaea]|uniref:U3 small nucleolar RNA-associated 4-like n=1 Tax=Olea europaea subsp. europaea TaxID=158383 RepID=A0A8S0QSE5_OLEEU|nr:U3 small nucleolar RNA-associated 4-like [Olea europaea subsp. europaea]
MAVSESTVCLNQRNLLTKKLCQGRSLSVTCSPDATRIFSGSSGGFIRCWDAKLAHEIYRMTVVLGGLGNGTDLCIWSFTCTKFWDGRLGTLLQARSYHKGDVNALAADPSHNRVSLLDILYKHSSDAVGSCDAHFVSDAIKKCIYVGYVRTHTHDVRALSLAVRITHEDDVLPDEKVKGRRFKQKPHEHSYRKWAHSGVPMLVLAGFSLVRYFPCSREQCSCPFCWACNYRFGGTS